MERGRPSAADVTVKDVQRALMTANRMAVIAEVSEEGNLSFTEKRNARNAFLNACKELKQVTDMLYNRAVDFRKARKA